MLMKRLLTIFLVAVMIIPVLPVVADETQINSTNNEFNLYQKRLEGLGIIPPGMDLQGSLTRAEMASILERIFADENTVYNQQIFSDVLDTDQSAAINFANDMGIMRGYPDGTFRPENPLTYVEIVKILVSMTGYQYKAELNGGYPAGYISTAAQNGILPGGVSYSNDDHVKIRDAVYMVYKDINVSVMERELGNKDAKYVINDAHTLMDDIMETKHLHYSKGIVTSNGVTDISKPIEKQDNTAVINDFAMHNDTVALDVYLGKSVEYWYNTEDETKPTLSYVYENGDMNSTVTYTSDEIDSGSFSQYVVTRDGEDSEELELSSPSIVYNGQGLSNITKDKLVPSNGSITLIDNNNDGKYDVVFIWDENVYVVSQVGVGGYDLQLKDIDDSQTTHLYVDKDDESFIYEVMNSDGQKMNPMEIGVDDVLNVAKSDDGTRITVFVSTEKVDGIVQEYSDSDGTVRINDVDYEIAKIGGRYVNLDIGLNSEGTFYLDRNKKVVYFENSVSTRKFYAYLMEYGTNGGLLGDIQVKLVTASVLSSLSSRRYWWQQDMLVQNKATEIYDLADKVTLDNASHRSSEISSNLALLDAYKYKVVSVELNNDGQVKSMETLQPDIEMTKGKLNPDTRSVSDKENVISLSGYINCLAMPDKDLDDPNVHAEDIALIESEEAVLGKYRMVPDTEVNIMAYKIPDNSQTPELLVMNVDMKPEGDAEGADTDMQLINSISEVYDKDLGEAYKMNYYDMNGYYTSAVIRPDVVVEGEKTSIEDLTAGDLVFIYFDYKGKVMKIDVRQTLIPKLQDASRPDHGYGKLGSTKDDDNMVHSVFGKVSNIKENTLWATDNSFVANVFDVDLGNGENTHVYADSSKVIFKYSKSKNKITTMKINDIVTGNTDSDNGDEILAKIDNTVAEDSTQNNKSEYKSLCTMIITK